MFAVMEKEEPAKASEALQMLQSGGGGKRNIKAFATLINSWSRKRQVKMDHKVVEMDQLDHYNHWKGHGRSDKKIEK